MTFQEHSPVGQQVIALAEDRNSGESQNMLEAKENHIIIIIYVKQIAILISI